MAFTTSTNIEYLGMNITKYVQEQTKIQWKMQYIIERKKLNNRRENMFTHKKTHYY